MKRNLNAFIQQAQLDAKIEEEAKAILEAAELIDSVCQAFNVSPKEAAEAIATSLRCGFVSSASGEVLIYAPRLGTGPQKLGPEKEEDE